MHLSMYSPTPPHLGTVWGKVGIWLIGLLNLPAWGLAAVSNPHLLPLAISTDLATVLVLLIILYGTCQICPIWGIHFSSNHL